MTLGYLLWVSPNEPTVASHSLNVSEVCSANIAADEYWLIYVQSRVQAQTQASTIRSKNNPGQIEFQRKSSN